MHLITDATDVEDYKILAIAVDQTFELADHDAALPLSPCGRGCPSGPCGRGCPSGARAGEGSLSAETNPSPGSNSLRSFSPPSPTRGEGKKGTAQLNLRPLIIPRPPSAAAWRSGGDARA